MEARKNVSPAIVAAALAVVLLLLAWVAFRILRPPTTSFQGLSAQEQQAQGPPDSALAPSPTGVTNAMGAPPGQPAGGMVMPGDTVPR